MSVRIQIKKHPNDSIITGILRHGKHPAMIGIKKTDRLGRLSVILLDALAFEHLVHQGFVIFDFVP